ncbi:hypothetical protein GUF45_28200, partial [Xanthomonas citri pv. citri]|nr:hypothetical protein [Xanthomonas citri pv. citri]
MHWGPYWPVNRYPWTHADYLSTSGASFADEFNVWSMDWTDEFVRVSLNDVELLYMDPITNFFEYGNFSATDDN